MACVDIWTSQPKTNGQRWQVAGAGVSGGDERSEKIAPFAEIVWQVATGNIYPMYKRHETIIASGNVELGHIQYTWMPKSIQVQNPAGGKNVQRKR